jgi:protein dithiol oxidoreductase (disulfide-forming)
MQIIRHASSLVFAVLLLGVSASFIASPPVHAQDIKVLNPPQPVDNDGKIEVLEWFAYGCIHCANLEATFDKWAKAQPADVKVKRVPSPARLLGIDSTALFYTLEAMGELYRNGLHNKIFEAAHTERVMLGHKPTLLKWLEKNGIDPKKYEDVERSFSVVSKVSRAVRMIESYKIDVTPTIVVDGRFVVTPGQDPPEAYLKRIDAIVAEARARATAKK